MAKVVKLGGSAPAAPAAAGPKTEKVVLTKPRALALQTELLDAFTMPKFQKKLNELARKHSKSEERSKAYSSFRNLVRKSQREIIPRYGFDASEEGVECMMKAFRDFKDDPDIYVNECAIKEALSLTQSDGPHSDVSTPPFSESLLRERNAQGAGGTGGSSSAPIRNLVVVWLRRLIIRFSTPTFQAFRAKTKSLFGNSANQDLSDLSQEQDIPIPSEAPCEEQNFGRSGPEDSQDHGDNTEPMESNDFEGYYQVLAKADGGGSMQSRLEGVKIMIREVCMFDDVEVVQLFNTMNMKLGMAADACGPFRDSLRLHLIQADEHGTS